MGSVELFLSLRLSHWLDNQWVCWSDIGGNRKKEAQLSSQYRVSRLWLPPDVGCFTPKWNHQCLSAQKQAPGRWGPLGTLSSAASFSWKPDHLYNPGRKHLLLSKEGSWDAVGLHTPKETQGCWGDHRLRLPIPTPWKPWPTYATKSWTPERQTEGGAEM